MKNKGITLIALIITIVVLLIIAGISVGFITGDNGILNKAQSASFETEKESAKEKINLAITELRINNNGNSLKLIDLNKLEDATSESYNTNITLEKQVEDGDISTIAVVDGKYRFNIDSGFNISYLDSSNGTTLADGLITYTTFDDVLKDGSLKEQLKNIDYTNVVSGSIYPTNIAKKIGAGSAYFTGVTSQRLTSSISNLNLGTSDFTVEFWVNPLTQTMQCSTLFSDDDNNNIQFFISDVASGGNISLTIGTSCTRVINTGKTYTQNTWTHYSVVRKNGVFTVYENGINIGQTSLYLTTSINLSKLSIGGNCSTSNTAYKGYMDDFAIYNYAKYTSDFTPIAVANSDANLAYSSFDDCSIGITDTILNKEYNNIVKSAVVTTDTNCKYGRSGYFQGVTSQRLVMQVPNLNLGTSDFTVEFWVNPLTQIMQCSTLFSDDDNNNIQFFISDVASGGNISLTIGTSCTRVINTGKTYTPNTWTHYSVVRKNGVFTIYENGINIGQTSSYLTTSINFSKLSIGGNCSTSNTAYKGYMDDFAIYNYAKYTSNFAVSNKPLGIK